MPAPKPERDEKILARWADGFTAKEIRAELSLTSVWVVYEVSRKDRERQREG